MRNWATFNGKAVRQRSNRQQATMAAAGTSPISMYEIEKTENINQVKVVFSFKFYKYSSSLLVFSKY